MSAELYGAMAFNTLLNAGTNLINQHLAGQQTDYDRAENFRYGEMAANAADRRTRALYSDIYSPQALLRQYKEAGLSPSLMFGGTPGQGGTAGAQGNGASGAQTPYMPISLLEGAQIANIIAQTKKTEAETTNIKTDTARQEIQKGIEELAASQYNKEWQLLNSTWTENGKKKSLFEAAQEHYSYDSFMQWCRDGNTDEAIKEATTTEAGQKILRTIYQAASQMNRDIMVLSEETINANFQIEILKALKEKDFANLNADAAVQELKTSISTNELTESQKEAWNNLLDRLGKKGSTGRDIAIILAMILNNYSGKVGVKINTGRK